MNNVKEIHALYQVHCEDAEVKGHDPLDYDRFLEEMFIASCDENEQLVDEIAKYQQAVDASHRHYRAEVKKREELAVLVETVEALLATGDVVLALAYLKAEGLDKKMLFDRLGDVIVELDQKIAECEDDELLADLKLRRCNVSDEQWNLINW